MHEHSINRSQIEIRPVADLKPALRNARTHPKEQIKEIARSLERFGFCNPVLIQDDGTIVAGHGRVEAAKLLGITEVPTLRLSHLTSSQIRAYALADNRLAEKAGWDREILAIELQGLIDLDFDVEITGFSMSAIDQLLPTNVEAGSSNEEYIEPQPDALQISIPGDLWLLGKHRLFHGSALDGSAYTKLMQGDEATMIFGDPPYNVPIDGHVSGLGRTQHREFAMASGEMSEVEFTNFLTNIFRHLVNHSVDGSIHFHCMDWRHFGQILAAGNAVYDEFKQLCVWNKSNAGMGSLYRSKHELVLVFKRGKASHVNNVELGKHGRSRSNVWDYPGVNTFRRGREEALSVHPTVKPVALVADAILDVSRRNDVVLDPFGGSGTTLIAAERTGRRARLIEIDALYCDAIIRRWKRETGKQAILAESGRSFDDIAAERAAIIHAARQRAVPVTAQQAGVI
jgi:DNA modification methylase